MLHLAHRTNLSEERGNRAMLPYAISAMPRRGTSISPLDTACSAEPRLRSRQRDFRWGSVAGKADLCSSRAQPQLLPEDSVSRPARPMFALLVATFLAGCSISVQAPIAKPNYVAGTQFPSPAKGSVTGATDAETCSQTPGIKELCVTGLKSALEGPFSKMVSEFSGTGDGVVDATLEVVEVTLAPAAVDARGLVADAYMQMKWKLILKDSSGKTVAAVAETTVAVGSAFAAEDAFGALEAAVLERAAVVLKESAEKMSSPSGAADSN